jgi:hypothetical protein
VTADGTATVSFSCDGQQTIFGSVYEATGQGEQIDARGWSYWLTIDANEIVLTAPQASDSKGSVVRSTFVVPPDVVRLARSATQIGLRMKPPREGSTAIGYSVDIDDTSASIVRSFLGNCLRR